MKKCGKCDKEYENWETTCLSCNVALEEIIVKKDSQEVNTRENSDISETGYKNTTAMILSILSVAFLCIGCLVSVTLANEFSISNNFSWNIFIPMIISVGFIATIIMCLAEIVEKLHRIELNTRKKDI